MRRMLMLIAVVVGLVAVSTTAWAEPPAVHVSDVTKDISLPGVPTLAQCPGGATTLDLTFKESFHLLLTSTSFHFNDSQTGTFIGRGPSNEVVSTGHFVNLSNRQGPGFPKETFTSVINATGTTTDGSHIQIHILEHLNITPSGDPIVAFERVNC